MSGKRRQHRQRFSKRELSRRDYQPLWDDAEAAEASWDDLEDEWDDDESWEEPEGFWDDSGDDWDSPGNASLRSRGGEDWD